MVDKRTYKQATAANLGSGGMCKVKLSNQCHVSFIPSTKNKGDSTYMTPTVPSAQIQKTGSLVSKHTGSNLSWDKDNSFHNGNATYVGQDCALVQTVSVNPGKRKHY